MTDQTDKIEVRRLKLLLLTASLVTLVFLFLAAFEENLTGQWRSHQAAYRDALIGRAQTAEARQAAGKMEIAHQQLFLPQLERIDRCVTCHVGIDDPNQTAAEQPLRAHSGNIFKHHPVDKFGCTVCHDGQGSATDEAAAHGEVAHWPAPLLRGAATYTSCGRCHYENDLYGAEDDLYARGGPHTALDQRELTASVEGAGAIARGKRLVLESGCLGCHTFRGRGGGIGPDITYVGDKTKHDLSFEHVEGEHTVAQWLYEHFKQPEKVSPGSLMPDLRLADDEADALTQYMLSLHRKSMPARYTPVPPRRSGLPATGAQLYAMFCSSCHGPDGQGSTVREASTAHAIDAPPQLMVPSLNPS